MSAPPAASPNAKRSPTWRTPSGCASTRIRVNPHVWGTGVALAASLQLIAALPHNPPGLHPVEPLLEFDRSEHPIRMAVLQEPIEQRDGWVEIPQGPGLGIAIDRAALAHFAA